MNFTHQFSIEITPESQIRLMERQIQDWEVIAAGKLDILSYI